MFARRLFALLLLALVPATPGSAAMRRVGVDETGDQLRWGFSPPSIVVAVGDVVDFVNDGREPHTFSSQGSSLFDSGTVEPGRDFSFTFREPGKFHYLCIIHPQMLGSVAVLAAPMPAPAGAPDWDIAGGHFFTQTGGGSGKGYAVTDEVGVRFWSEFLRFGGVQAVGYPASQRFLWDGFTVQVFQRVIFQWRPEVAQAYFVNVFDRLHDLGKDDFLQQVRQTPRPRPFADAGKSWPDIVQEHLAVLEAHPAIKAAYFDVVGDAVQANGLPVSDVVDQGNHVALRAQRVVYQQWKEDVPWAKKGQVTAALGGDIAKEAGVLPQPHALQPVDSPAR